MSVRRRIADIGIYAALGIITIYTGICAGKALIKAVTQVHLASGTSVYFFTGYYMIAALYGAACLLALAGIIVYSVMKRRYAVIRK